MRNLFVFLITCLLLQSIKAQVERSQQRPSPKQVQQQVAEANKEAQQMITDLEKQIAEARVNKENPESIKELEDQLATMKKMMGVIDRASARINTRPPKMDSLFSKSPSYPSYKSPFVRIKLKQPVVAPTEKEAKDHLLWYRGRRLNDSTLVTRNARVIRYSRQRNMVIVQPDERRDSNYMRIIESLGRSRQWTNTYVNKVAAIKNSFFDYPLVMMVMRKYELIEQEYNKIANNTFDLPGSGTDPRVETFYQLPLYQLSSSHGPSANDELKASELDDPYLEQIHRELQALLNNPPSLDFPAPPKQEYGLCYYCDTSAQTRYDREKEIWGEKFNEYEAKLLQYYHIVYRYFALLEGNISDANMPVLEADINRAYNLAISRWQQKLELLRQQYETDIYRYECVISSVLAFERFWALLGAANENFSYEFIIFSSRIFQDFMFDRMAARDYDVIFNYALILGFARQKALLGGTDDDYLQDVTDAVIKLNRFALTLNIDFNFQIKGMDDKPVLIANGNLSTPRKVYVKLGRNQDCKWQFYLFDPDYAIGLTVEEDDFKIPITVNNGIKQVEKKKGVWVTYPYAGPAEMSMNFPSFRISFCQGSGQDSAMMDILRYKAEDLSGYDIVDNYTVDLLEYVNKMLVSVSNTKANQNELIDMVDEMINISSRATVDRPTGYAKLDKMQVGYKMNGLQHGLQKRVTETTKGDNTVLLFDVQNGTDYLINNTANTPNSEFYMEIKTGAIKLKVVLEPL